MTDGKKVLMGMTAAELKGLCRSLGMPAFTGGQIAQWLYQKHVTDISQMTNLSKANREKLAEQYELLLSTYSQQDRYLILGCYPNVWEDKEAYDSALEEAFGDHYVSLNRTVTNKLMTEDGRREMAQVIYARLENLGYLGNE